MILKQSLTSDAIRLLSLVALPVILLAYTFNVAGTTEVEIANARRSVEEGEKKLARILTLREASARFQRNFTRLKGANPKTRSLSSRVEAITKSKSFADKMVGMFKRKGKPFDGTTGQERVEITFQRVTMEEVVAILKALEAPSNGLKIERMDLRLLGQQVGLLRLEVSALTFG